MGRRSRGPVIRIKLDLTDIRRTLKGLEKGFADTARRAGKEAKGAADETSKQAKRAAKNVDNSLKEGLGGADRVAQALGGTLGDITGTVENLVVGTQELNEVLGPMPAAVGGITLALGAGAAAAVAMGLAYRDLITNSHELLQEWQDLEGFDPIGQDTIAAINDAKNSLDSTASVAERAQLVFSGDLAEALDGTAGLFTVVLTAANELEGGITTLKTTSEGLGRALLLATAPPLLALSEATKVAAEKGEQLNDTLTEQRQATEAQGIAAGVLERIEERQAEARTERIAKEKEQRQEQERIEAAQAKAREERNKRWIARIEKTQAAVQSLDAVTRRRAGSTVSEEVKIQQEYQETNRLIEEQIDRLLAVGDVGQDTAAALAATQRAQQANEEARARALEQLEAKRTATLRKEQEKRAQDFIRAEEQRAEALAGIEERIARTRAENNAAALDLTMTLANTTTDALQLVSEREQEADLRDLDNKRRKIQELKALRAEAQERRKQARKDNDTAELASAEADLAQIKRRMGARREEARAIRKSLRRQARAQKALALTSVATNTAAGIVRTIALMGAPVPPNIPAIAGVAAVAASGAVQAARIASERLPTFAHGGAVTPGGPDHRAVSVSPREAILNERATQRLGSQGINALNHDQALTPQVTVVQTLDRRVIASAMADTIPAAVARELDAQQGLMPGQRTVYRRD